MSDNKNFKVYREGIFTSIMKILGGGKFRREMKKLEKVGKDDAELQATLDSLAYSNKKLQRKLKNFCKRNPSNDLCKGKGKSMFTDAKY